MAFQNCFKNPNDDLNSGQYISRKKSKAIFKNAGDLANNGGVYHKKTSLGQTKGTYVGDVNISRDGNKCLIGASSYDVLLSVTNGKYLEQPSTFQVEDLNTLRSGSLYKMDLSGVTSILSHPDGSYNTFLYPPKILANQTYPILTPPSDQGLIVDPCYNVFYPNTNDNHSSNVCYSNNESAYQQFTKTINMTSNDKTNYIKSKNSYVGGYRYPNPFSFDCSYIHTDILSANNQSIPASTPVPATQTVPGPTATTFTLTNGRSNMTLDIIDVLTSESYTTYFDNNSIKSVIIGTKVTTIGANAFTGATNLTSVTFTGGSQLLSNGGNAFLKSIGDESFSGATSLTSFIIPNTVTYIGFNAFQYSKLTTFTMSEPLANILGVTFGYNNNGEYGAFKIPFYGLTSVNIYNIIQPF